jgi:hypothetical protein
MSEKNTLGRRSFLKMGSAIAAAPSVAGKITLGRSSDRGTEVYSSSFVPDGAECRLAFVADHHYWPNHLENWGGGSQITSSTDRRMPDLVQALNDENPDLSVHAGDVVSAGGSFFPSTGGIRPAVGVHETLLRWVGSSVFSSCGKPRDA